MDQDPSLLKEQKERLVGTEGSGEATRILGSGWEEDDSYKSAGCCVTRVWCVKVGRRNLCWQIRRFNPVL
jgi:hypothetical protein